MKEKLIQRQQELLDKAKAAGRELTVEEKAEFDEITAKIADLAKKSAEPEQTVVSSPSENVEAVREAAAQAERSRIREIEAMCNHFGIEAREYVDSNISVDGARKAIMEKMMKENAPISQSGSVEVTKDASDKFRDAASDALLMRAGIELEHPAEGAKELRGLSLRDIFIEASGDHSLIRRDSDDLFNMAMSRQYYNPVAAFPSILDQTINKAYVEGHKKVAVTFDRFTTKGSLKDFKVANGAYLAGPVGEFLEVPEGAELKHDRPADAKLPSRQLKTYGRQFTLSRQAFIDDDIGLVTSIPARYAASARKTINKQVYSILVNNPAIYDGVALFNSAHRNVLTTGTGVTAAALMAMFMALQTQNDQFGEAIIIRPATVVVPVGYAFDFATILNSPTINTAGNTQANNPLYPYRNSLEIVEDPTLNVLCGGWGQTMPWFLVGATEDTSFIQVDYLNGQEVPTIRRGEPMGSLGFVWDIYLDWGVNVLDFRGAIKNPGTTVADPLS